MYVCIYGWMLSSDFLRPHGRQPTRFLYPWDFPGKKYWSGLPFPPPGDLSDSRIKPTPPVVPALASNPLPLSHLGSPYFSLYIIAYTHLH